MLFRSIGLHTSFVLLSVVVGGWVVGGCAQPTCPSDPSEPFCSGACTGNGSRCVVPGTGCQCVEGCWRQFSDGPCSPPRDAGGGDAGRTCRPTMFPSISGACSVEGERRCVVTDGCTCVGGCWSCAFDLCWVADTGADVSAPDVGDGVDASVDVGLSIDTGLDALSVPDVGVPATMTYCVDIDVSNTCAMTVTPPEIDIPADQTAYFCWRNRSRDYAVDVWLSYGGGYTDLAPGATWNEPPGHCLGPLAHDEYADITTACSSHRFLIHCL